MAKRLHEDVVPADSVALAERAAKKAKKEKKEKKAAANGNDVVENVEKKKRGEEKTGSDSPAVNGEEDSTKLSKEERKALKRAKKEQEKASAAEEAAENVTDGTGDADAAAKAERKALKHAEKAARKAAKASNQDETNGHASSAPSTTTTADDVATGYTENATLAALPQADIDAFLSEKHITVTDASPSYRPIISFDYLPISDPAQRAPLKNFSAPTPIQAAAWPYMLAGKDVIGVAETGSGKTMAFGLPCVRRLNGLDKKERRHIKACMVSPTRELALQITEQLVKLATPFGLKVTVVYGGVSKDEQRKTLAGTNIVVATPGRLNDFIQEGSIDLSHVDYMVLDEADRMLDTGFEQEVRKIMSTTSTADRQTLMFTATWPQSVRDLAATFMKSPVKVNIGDNPTGELRANTRIVQEVEVIEQRDKQERLIQLLKQYQSGKNKGDRILVFCLYKKEATRIEEFIRRRGFNVAGIHGDLSQQQRTQSLEAFKQGHVPLLVATDVAARGLDIPAVKLVINVTFPLTAEDYVHRIGRTGRAGQDGRAITMFTDAEKGLAGALINVLKGANQPVPEDLLKFGTTVKKKAHDAYGAFYKDPTDMKKATRITFD